MQKNFVIRAYARPCGIMLSLKVNGATGKAQFIAKNARNNQMEEIPLSLVASSAILQELDAKSGFNAALGDDWALMTVAVSMVTKHFINDCWDELKKLKPQFCIK